MIHPQISQSRDLRAMALTAQCRAMHAALALGTGHGGGDVHLFVTEENSDSDPPSRHLIRSQATRSSGQHVTAVSIDLLQSTPKGNTNACLL